METMGGDNAVTICCKGEKKCHFLDGFLDIYIDDEEAPSPFKTLDDAMKFAKIIINLLELIENGQGGTEDNHTSSTD